MLEVRIGKALDPPRVSRMTPVDRLDAVAACSAVLFGRGAQLDQSNLPGTCASSSTR
jgi:hypothetical protein